VVIVGLLLAAQSRAADPPLQGLALQLVGAGQGVFVDADDGTVLVAEAADVPVHPASVTKVATSPLGLVVLIGITWSFFQHLLSGIRHLVMDTGASFELGVNKTFAILTIVGSIVLTAAVWFYVLGVAK